MQDRVYLCVFKLYSFSEPEKKDSCLLQNAPKLFPSLEPLKSNIVIPSPPACVCMFDCVDGGGGLTYPTMTLYLLYSYG